MPLREDSPIWQRNDHEHIICDEDEWARATTYIEANPANWENDAEFNRQSR